MMVDSSISGKVQREGCLTDGWTGRKDDKIRILPASCNPVQGRKTGRNSAQTRSGLILFDFLHRIIDDRAYILNIPFEIALNDIVDPGLRLVDQVVHNDRVVIGILENPIGSGDEVTLDALLLQDLDIILDMGSSTDLAGKLDQSDSAAHCLEISFAAQGGSHRDDVDRAMFSHKLTDRLEDHPVLGVVETTCSKFFQSHIDYGRLQQHGTKDSLFNIKSLRRSSTHLKPKCFQIDCLRLFL